MSIYQSEAAHASLAAWYPKFRARIGKPVEERDVSTRFGQTHLIVAGPEDSGKPPVVVLHGAFASSAHTALEIHPMLSKRRVYCLDILGHSPMSADHRLPPEGSAYAEWISDVLDALGLTTVDLVGVSYGGFVAQRCATGVPHRFRKLVLIVPAGVVATPALPALWRVALPMMGWKLLGRQASLRAFCASQMTTEDEDWIGWLGEALNGFTMFSAPSPATMEDAARWKGPVLAFGATDDVHFPGDPLLARIKELYPHAETERWVGYRHAPPFTDEFRGELSERIERFLG